MFNGKELWIYFRGSFFYFYIQPAILCGYLRSIVDVDNLIDDPYPHGQWSTKANKNSYFKIYYTVMCYSRSFDFGVFDDSEDF